MIHLLPTVNATLNAISAVLLVWGYTLIRRKQIEQPPDGDADGVRHVAACSWCATWCITRRWGARCRSGTRARCCAPIYFSILIPHTILAATVPVLAIITLRRGLAAKYDRHRSIARWTLPIWLFVSVTGVIVYVMLYHM